MIMSSLNSRFALLASLAGGILIGLAFGRGGALISAQTTSSVSGSSKSSEAELQAPPLNAPVPGSAPALKRDVLDPELEIYDKLARQYQQFAQINRTFELVAEAVSPSVVHIVAQKSGRSSNDVPKSRRYDETGSGVIVRADHGRDLYVLTNNHVVEGARPERINIFLKDGTAIHPVRTWLDSKADIAVMALGRNDLPAARLGDSDAMAVGSWVLAVGSPFGLTHSVSQGIISARGRHMDELEDVENQDFLQTDAAINPGNSGGPLVNLKGEVIGINNSIASNGGGNEGVGFSIPINLARWILNQLINKGHVTRGALGINLHPERDYRPEDALAHGLERARGAWISVVHQYSPAAEAGLKDDDIILSYRGVDVLDLNHLINMVSMSPVGEPVEVVILRNRKQIRLTVKIGERDRSSVVQAPASERPAAGEFLRRPSRPAQDSSQSLGLELTTLDGNGSKRLGLPADRQGALVSRIAPDSPLSSLFKTNDIISSVNGQPITTADQALEALNHSREEEGTLEFGIDRLVEGALQRRSVRIP